MAKKQPAPKGRSSGKSNAYDRIIVVGIVLALIAIALILWGPVGRHRGKEKQKTPEQAKKLEPEAKKKKPSRKPERKRDKKEIKEAKKHEEVVIAKSGEVKRSTERAAVKSGEKAYLVAIVIDDLGQDLKIAQEILSIPVNLTFGIMPGLPESGAIAELAKKKNHDVLLHLPMEYRSRNGKPAPGMLRSDMTPMDFVKTINEDLKTVPTAVGVNNHEGSSLTENREAMKFLMAELKTRNFLFLDSLTTPKSVAYATAKEFGLKTAKRDVFLDNESDNPEYVGKQLEELARIAKGHGTAIGIGHPHHATIDALRKWLPAASAEGIEIVPVSRLMQ